MTMHDEALVALAARATLVPTSIKMYVPGGDNELQPSYVSLDRAVASGRAFCGEVREEWLAIDLDIEEVDEVEVVTGEVVSLIEAAADCLIAVLDSGSQERVGRHVWVYLPSLFDRKVLIDQLQELARPGVGVDVRGGPGRLMRSPLGPHRKGGCSVALNMGDEDLIDLFESVPAWRPRQGDHRREELFGRLQAQAQQLLRGNIPDGLRYPDGRPDRSRVEMTLAHYSVNACFSEDEFVELRTLWFPSEWASEKRNPERPLRLKYGYASRRQPASTFRQQIEQDVERLYQHAVELDFDKDLRRRRPGALRLLRALCDKAVVLGETRFPMSYRELAKQASMGGNPTVLRAVNTLEQMGLITMTRGRQGADRCTVFDLVIPPVSRSRTNHTGGRGVQADWYGNEKIPPRTHTLFRAGALPPSAYEIIKALVQPHTRKELVAMMHGTWSPGTVYRTIELLIDKGVLDEHDDHRVQVPSTINWDDTTHRLGAFHLQHKTERRIAAEQHQFVENTVAHYWAANNDSNEPPFETLIDPDTNRIVIVDSESGEVIPRTQIEERCFFKSNPTTRIATYRITDAG